MNRWSTEQEDSEMVIGANMNMFDILESAKFELGPIYPYGPAGIVFVVRNNARKGSIIVSQADNWLHASIAFDDGMPTYADLKLLHHAVFGRNRYAYQVFAPLKKHVNVHSYALHLFGMVNGANVLPDFAPFGTI